MESENPGRGASLKTWGARVPSARVAVLAVHGRGQTPEFMQLESDRLGESAARYFGPSAAESSWYPHPFMDDVDTNQPALARSLETIRDSLSAIAAEGFDTRHTVLWGFSQGACLLAEHLLEYPEPFGGVALMTGGYLGPASRLEPASNRFDRVRVIIRGHSHDPWVPAIRMTETAQLLTRGGAKVDFEIEPGDEHKISEGAAAAVARLLRDVALS